MIDNKNIALLIAINDYKGTENDLNGCLEDQTKWMRGKRLAANPGFGIYDITFNNSGITKLNETFYPFY